MRACLDGQAPSMGPAQSLSSPPGSQGNIRFIFKSPWALFLFFTLESINGKDAKEVGRDASGTGGWASLNTPAATKHNSIGATK